jgi:hypothetical protein
LPRRSIVPIVHELINVDNFSELTFEEALRGGLEAILRSVEAPPRRSIVPIVHELINVDNFSELTFEEALRAGLEATLRSVDAPPRRSIVPINPVKPSFPFCV